MIVTTTTMSTFLFLLAIGQPAVFGAVLRLEVWTGTASCSTATDINGTIISRMQTVTVNTQSPENSWGMPFSPSCSEILTFAGLDLSPSGSITTGANCFTSFNQVSIPPGSAPSDPMISFAQRFDLFRSIMDSTDSYATSFNSFHIASCTEPSGSLQLQRDTKDFDLAKATDCYYVDAASNLTTTCALSKFQYLTLSLSFQMQAQTLPSPRMDYILSGALRTSFASDVPAGCDTDSKTWQLNQTTSGLRRDSFIPGGVTVYPLDINTPLVTLRFDGAPPPPNPDLFDMVANTVTMTMGSGNKDDTVTVEIVRPNGRSCSVVYKVARLQGLRKWGTFLQPKEFNTTSGTLSKKSVTPISGETAYAIAGRECIPKCMSSLIVTTPGDTFNPYYSTSPSVSPIRFPSFVSGYDGTDCLCGAGNPSYIRLSNRNSLDQPNPEVMGQLQELATGDLEDLQVRYDVTSGRAYGASPAPDNSQVGPIAGGTVGGMIAFAVFCVAFFVLSHKMNDKVEEGSASLTTKTSSPLSGVQLFLLALATALAMSAVCSPDMFSVIAAFPASGSTPAYTGTYSVGIFYHIEANTRIGAGFVGGAQIYFAQASANNLEYSCMQFLEESTNAVGGSADFNWDAVYACQAMRATSVVSVLVGALAIVCAFYKYQRAVLPLTVVATLCVIIAFGVFHTQIIDRWIQNRVDNNPWTKVYGSAFNCLVASFFFFLLEIAAWVIDYFKSEELK